MLSNFVKQNVQSDNYNDNNNENTNNHSMMFRCQDYLREQPDNLKSFNIIGEVTQFLNVIYSNVNGKNIDLTIQLFESINEFTAVSTFKYS